MIRKIPEKSSWNLDNFELTFRENLRNTMQEIISRARPKLPQDAMNWLYCILNGVTQKSHITEQVQPHLAANSTWQYIRRWLLSKGVRDNPKTPYTNYDLGNDDNSAVCVGSVTSPDTDKIYYLVAGPAYDNTIDWNNTGAWKD